MNTTPELIKAILTYITSFNEISPMVPYAFNQIPLSYHNVSIMFQLTYQQCLVAYILLYSVLCHAIEIDIPLNGNKHLTK